MRNKENIPNTTIYYRLIALWVLTEAMLGGIIHGFKIPISGLVVGSSAVICICLIAWYNPGKGSIIKATIIVAVFKMMLSPQAPLPAYIAVFFQGLLGELLFQNRKFYKLSCILLAILALLESGLQRILVLTIVYGNDLWKVVNDFINGLTRQKVAANYSLIVGSAYVIIHLIAGIVAGWFAAVLPQRIAQWNQQDYFIPENTEANIPVPAAQKKKRFKIWPFIIWAILILLYIQSYFGIGTPLLPSHISLKILLRSLIIVLTWYLIAGPLLKRLLHGWLQKRKTKLKADIQEVLELLPRMQQLALKSWKLSYSESGWKRIVLTGKIILVNVLAVHKPYNINNVYILTGNIQSGKTSSLIKWSANRKDVFGILSPVVNGKRVFMNAHTRELFPMEANEEEQEVLQVGRFVFSKNSFDKAIQLIGGADNKEGWLIMDEIGPLELAKGGFYKVLIEVLQQRYRQPERKILLVVRKGLVDKIRELIQVDDIYVTYDITEPIMYQ